MQVSKAVITAAGRGARQYPASDTVQKAMLPLVDRDGLTKPLLQIIAEEAIDSGIEELCVVSAPGDEARYRAQFRAIADHLRSSFRSVAWAEEQARRVAELESRLRFVEQHEPEGYGHAVWSAREFVGDNPFLLLLGDHLYISRESRRCARQLIDLATAEGCAVSAVQATREHLIHQYGTLTGRRLHDRPDAYQIDENVRWASNRLVAITSRHLGFFVIRTPRLTNPGSWLAYAQSGVDGRDAVIRPASPIRGRLDVIAFFIRHNLLSI